VRAIVLLPLFLSSGCICPLVAGGLVATADNDPVATPEPDRSDPSFFKHAPPSSTVAAVASQTGRATFIGKSLELQAPAVLRMKSGKEARGVLDAVTDEVVQIKSGDLKYSYRASEVVEIAQF
jgi:hypothetical protein